MSQHYNFLNTNTNVIVKNVASIVIPGVITIIDIFNMKKYKDTQRLHTSNIIKTIQMIHMNVICNNQAQNYHTSITNRLKDNFTSYTDVFVYFIPDHSNTSYIPEIITAIPCL